MPCRQTPLDLTATAARRPAEPGSGWLLPQTPAGCVLLLTAACRQGQGDFKMTGRPEKLHSRDARSQKSPVQAGSEGAGGAIANHLVVEPSSHLVSFLCCCSGGSHAAKVPWQSI